MKRKLFITALCLGFFTAVYVFSTASAVSLMGGEISYRCLGNSQYEIKVRVYRDCNGINMSPSPVTVQSITGTTVINLTNQTLVSSTDVTGFCQPSVCSAGIYPYGIQENVYTTTLDLSSQTDCRWRISWEKQGRSSIITSGMADQNFYISAILDKCLNSCNSSPVFNTTVSGSSMLLCAQRHQVIDFSASDPDGDSLTYELVDPLQAANMSVSYNGTYSRNRPVRISPYQNEPFPESLNLKLERGFVKFMPNLANEAGVMAVQVNEWRMVNGRMTIIGSTRRDVMLVIRNNCAANQLPELAFPNFQTFCANKQVCINFTTADKDGDSVKLSWDGGLPGAVFSHNNGTTRFPAGQICWTPSDSQAGKNFIFSVIATDNACLNPDRVYRNFEVFVAEGPTGIPNRTVLNCGRVALGHTPLNLNSFGQWWYVYDLNGAPVWSTNKIQDTALLPPGKYTAELTLGTSQVSCPMKYYDTFEVHPYLTVSLPDESYYCKGSQVTLPFFVTGGAGNIEYNWYKTEDINRSNSLSQTATLTATPGSGYGYRLYAKDSLGCMAQDSVKMTSINADPGLLNHSSAGCPGKQASFIASGSSDLVQWFDMDGFTVNPLPPSLSDSTVFEPVITQDKLYIVRGVKTAFNITCQQFDTVSVTAYPVPAKPSIFQNGIMIFSTEKGAMYEWVRNGWDTTITYAASNGGLKIMNHGTYIVTVTNSFGCTNTSDTFSTIATSLSELTGVNGIRIYPNPSSGHFNIAMDLDVPAALSFRVYDTMGRLVYSGQSEFVSGVRQYPLSLTNMSQGAYHLVISDGQGSTHRVLIVN